MQVRPSVAARVVLDTFAVEEQRVCDAYEKRCAEDDNYRHPGWRLVFNREWVEKLAEQG